MAKEPGILYYAAWGFGLYVTYKLIRSLFKGKDKKDPRYDPYPYLYEDFPSYRAQNIIRFGDANSNKKKDPPALLPRAYRKRYPAHIPRTNPKPNSQTIQNKMIIQNKAPTKVQPRITDSTTKPVPVRDNTSITRPRYPMLIHITTPDEHNRAISLLHQDLARYRVLGFNIEKIGGIWILFIASWSGFCIVVRLDHEFRKFLPKFRDFLNDITILKLGPCHKGHVKFILSRNFGFSASGLVDLRHLAHHLQVIPTRITKMAEELMKDWIIRLPPTRQYEFGEWNMHAKNCILSMAVFQRLFEIYQKTNHGSDMWEQFVSLADGYKDIKFIWTPGQTRKYAHKQGKWNLKGCPPALKKWIE